MPAIRIRVAQMLPAVLRPAINGKEHVIRVGEPTEVSEDVAELLGDLGIGFDIIAEPTVEVIAPAGEVIEPAVPGVENPEAGTGETPTDLPPDAAEPAPAELTGEGETETGAAGEVVAETETVAGSGEQASTEA